MPRAQTKEYKSHMTTAKRLRTVTTYVARRYSDDAHHAEDHTALRDDAEVERMTEELCDMPEEKETLGAWIAKRKGEMKRATAKGRRVVRDNQTKKRTQTS